MRDGGNDDVPRFLLFFLYVLSRLYGALTSLRVCLYRDGVLRSRQISSTVISVGNITTGGTGKTPMTVYLAHLFHRLHYKTVIVSRGYSGTNEATGGIVSNGKELRMDAAMAGDEPYMMACKLPTIPVIVGRNRFSAAATAVEKFGAQIVILDDGFQHIQLERDLDIVLLDAARPLGNGHLLPRGMMREPARQLRRADVVICTRSVDEASPSSLSMPFRQQVPVFCSTHVPDFVGHVPLGSTGLPEHGFTNSGRLDPRCLKGQRVLAFSGIANNINFRETLEALGVEIGGFLPFSDHHRYTQDDIEVILRAARDSEADALLTTEKDYFRMVGHLMWPMDLWILGITISFGDQERAFISYLEEVLSIGDEIPTVQGWACHHG